MNALERENAELHADIAHLRHCARLQDSATAAVLERAEKAEKRVAELERDAGRYRWLEDHKIDYSSRDDGMQWATMEWCVEVASMAPATFDEAIDNAARGTK